MSLDHQEIAQLSDQMLPDPSVIGYDESPEEAAEGVLQRYEADAQASGEALFDPDPDGVDLRRRVKTHIMGRIISIQDATRLHLKPTLSTSLGSAWKRR